MRRLLPVLLPLALVVGLVTAAPSVAGPDCRKTPNAGPCKPKPSPSPTPTVSATPTPTPTPTPTSPPSTGLVPPVARDCSVDVSAAMTAWIQTLPDGSTIDLAGGCYLSNGTISMDRKNGITFDGHGATIKATQMTPWHGNRAQLWINLGSKVTIRNLTLRGVNNSPDCAQAGGVSCYDSGYEWDHNLNIVGTDGVLVDHVAFQHAWGDAVALSPGGSWDVNGVGALMARNVTVQNSSIDTTGRMAFGCTGCHNFTAQDNTITNVGYHVVDVEVEAPAWTGDATLLRNTYSNVYLALLSATTGSGQVKRGPFVVRDNTRTDGPVVCGGEINVGSSAFRTGDVTVTGNRLHSYLEDVNVTNADTATITGNTGTGGSGGCGYNAGAAVLDTTTATITGNTFTSSAQVAYLRNTPAVVCGNSLNGALDQPRAC